MIPKFRAYDSSSYKRMYQPDEVMVGNGDIWIIDEDSCDNEWIVNNDLHLMQSTGLEDKNGKEIFEGDIVEFEDEVWYTDGGFYENKDEAYDSVQTNNRVVIIYDGFEWDLDNFWKGTSDCSSAWMSIFEDHMQSFKYFLQNEASVIGNIYENPELLEVTE